MCNRQSFVDSIVAKWLPSGDFLNYIDLIKQFVYIPQMLRTPLMTALMLLTSTSVFAHHLKRDFPEPKMVFDECGEVMNVDFTDPSLTLKASNGGTSAYAKIIFSGQTNPAGAFIPPNSSGIIDGEVTAYRVSLLLGQGQNVQAARLKELKDEELLRFQKFMTDTIWTKPAMAKNRESILALIDDKVQSGQSFFGALKCWNRRPYDFPELNSEDHKGLNLNSEIARWIQSDQAQPSSERQVVRTLNQTEVSATELQLASELSSQLLIDALMGQWDRFSGDNLQALIDPSHVFHLALYDNGGTWGDEEDVRHTLSFVTRFDRKAAQTILELDRAFSENVRFHGAKERQLRKFLQLDQDFSTEHWISFKRNVRITADHIRAEMSKANDRQATSSLFF